MNAIFSLIEHSELIIQPNYYCMCTYIPACSVQKIDLTKIYEKIEDIQHHSSKINAKIYSTNIDNQIKARQIF